MNDGNHTRRSVLRLAGVTVGAGALASMAGCSEVTSLVSGGAEYAQWLPEPGEINSSDHDSFTYLDTATLYDHEDELTSETVDGLERLEEYWQPVDVDWDETSSVLFTTSIVVEADYDEEDVIDDLEDEDFEDESEHGGYQIYAKDGRGIAIGDGRIITSSPFGLSEDPVGDIEDLIDVRNGDEDRYVDEEEDMQVLVDRLGGGTTVSGRTMEEPDDEFPADGVFDDMVAKGSVTTIDGDTADEKHVIVHGSESDVDLDDYEEWVEENDSSGEQFDDLDDVEYSKDGRVGVITGTKDTDEI